MVQFTSSNSYAYDGSGLRLSKTASGATTIYIRSGAQTIAEYAAGADPASPSREYLYMGSQLVASKAAGTYQWYIRDHLSPRMVYDDATATLLGYGHLPFGESWYGDTSEKWRFTSYERESDINQDFAVFRQYQFPKGRFTSPDPILGDPSDPQSWNRYTYTLNDPANLIDPLGLNESAPVCQIDGWFQVPCAALGGGVGYIVVPHEGNWVPSDRYPNCVYENNGDDRPGASPLVCDNGLNVLPRVGVEVIPANNSPNCTPGTKGCFNVPTKQEQCLSNAIARNQRQQQIFAGYAGSKLIGRVAIGAGIGAWRGWTRYNRGGSPWLIASQATVGALIGAGSSIWQDYNTIQTFDAQYMQDVQQCVVQNLAPGAPE